MPPHTYEALPRHGATQTEWDVFAALAQVDLLPWIADPNVKMAHYSRAIPGNKTPSFIHPEHGLGVGIKAFTSHIATDANIAAWRTDPRHGICMLTRNIRCIDVDIHDRRIAQDVEGHIREFLGIPGMEMPKRFRRDSGKFALLYRITDAPGELRKYVVRCVPRAKGEETPGMIEFLFDGQQTVLAGRHPAGARYEWQGGVQSLRDIPSFELETIRALIRELTEHYGNANAPAWRPERNKIHPDAAPLTHAEIAARDPAVTWLVENDWVKSFAPDGGLYVRCPWEHEHTTPTGETDSKYYPAGLNSAAPGFVCFHAHCHGRDANDFLSKTGYVASTFPVLPEPDPHEQQRPPLVMDKTGRIEFTLDNLIAAMQHADWSGVHVSYDTFRDEIIFKVGNKKWSTLTDTAYTEINLQLIRVGFKSLARKQLLIDAIHYCADLNKLDSAQEWLEVRKWDGVARIDRFHTEVMNLPDTPYHRAVSRYMWSALAGRVIDPGVKADMVPVLSGGQGLRKSMFVEALAPTPNEAVDISLDHRDSDLSRMLRGKLVAAWNEMRGLGTREESAIKGWITQRMDEWIPKFKEFGTKRLRRFIVIGTSNYHRYLTDPTGSRRFLPVQVNDDLNIDKLKEWRDQLWAEAAELYRKNGVQYEEVEALAAPARRAAEHVEVWTPRIRMWLASTKYDEVSVIDIMYHALQIPISQASRGHQERIRRAMLRIDGWKEHPDTGHWTFELA